MTLLIRCHNDCVVGLSAQKNIETNVIRKPDLVKKQIRTNNPVGETQKRMFSLHFKLNFTKLVYADKIKDILW